jgi:hypothetical protein
VAGTLPGVEENPEVAELLGHLVGDHGQRRPDAERRAVTKAAAITTPSTKL